MSPFVRAVVVAAGALAVSACAASNHSRIQAAQERQACAELGLDPGSSAFTGCVGDLDATVFAYMSSASH